MVLGLICAIIAGTLVSLQNIFNSKVNEQAGSWMTTTLVLGLGSLASFILGLFFEGGQLFDLQQMKWWYWISGLLGIGVITGIVQGIRYLGPTFAISIVLTSQLGFAVLLDSLGWMGLEKVPFTLKQLFGVVLILGGVIVFKWSEGRKKEAIDLPARNEKKLEVS
ncbi:DMT family transporter [Mesobacillus subterraneus]|uniref:DMT family transporter n=1 Tax=Mesobacillus subterraneus TaxID=285983 RepID=UPI00203C4C5A|nr:DMT family transporter [Mesobacillus subterraneus]MCM3665882.1 DMT family transporter [Mesobacillus subterraneus]MCM3684727.1 DMT family transporter [Mesobacillus subterraneus]